MLIKTRTRTFNIPLKDYLGYFPLKEFIKANFKQLDKTLYTSYYLKSIFPYAIFIIFFISAGLWSEIDNHSLDLETTVITLADKPKFVRDTGKSRNHHWKFKSEEYPAFVFMYPQRKAKVDLGKFSRNDKLNIMIAKDILEMKLLKTEAPSFRMKHFGWESIWVKGLKLER